MIGSTIQQVSKARSNTVRLLAFFLSLSVVYGLYFAQEWFLFPVALSLYTLKSYPSRRVNSPLGLSITVSLTDTLFLSMVLFSALGLIHPVRVKDGLIEILRWGVLWLVFRLGVRISRDESAKARLVQWIGLIGLAVAFLGWLPWIGKIDGRLSSVFGYSNAAAAFLGAVLLLHPSGKLVRIFLGISLLSTGSRAGVGLFLAVYLAQQAWEWIISPRHSFAGKQPLGKRGPLLRLSLIKIGPMILGIGGLILMAIGHQSAWENLTTWGFSSTSWLERIAYYRDGLRMAWDSNGLPRAGGWMAFPTVQNVPYWTSDPHSSLIHILLNQGILGILSMGIWGGFTLHHVWKYSRGKKPHYGSPREFSETLFENRVWMALVFLVLHSLVDADFSFGALGFLFWMLFGCIQNNDSNTLSVTFRLSTFSFKMFNKGILFVSLCIGLVSGCVIINPTILDREQAWNKLALQWSERDPEKSKAFWERSLKWDQTQMKAMRSQAELLLRHGNVDNGLNSVEDVLYWQPLDLEAYEWAQSLVWEEAETKRSTNPEIANKLYHWVERVPKRIEERIGRLNDSDRNLWKDYGEFHPSQHILLLAEYARQRQFTQLLLKT